jgi:hypothetical protein
MENDPWVHKFNKQQHLSYQQPWKFQITSSMLCNTNWKEKNVSEKETTKSRLKVDLTNLED